MKMDIRMLSQPSVAPLVRTVVIQNDVKLLVGWRFSNDHVHEPQEVLAALGFGDSRGHLAGGDLKGRKEIERAVAFVRAFKTAHDFPAVGFNVPCSPLNSLNTGLFVHADDQGVFRRS